MMDTLPEGILIKKDDAIVYTNKAIDTFLDISSEEQTDSIRPLQRATLNDSNTTEKHNSLPNSQLSLNDHLNKIFKENENNTLDIKFKDKNGKDRHFKAALLYLQFEGKNCKMCALTDLTLTMQMEREIISKKYEKIFLASFTHELLTPLNGILGIIDIIIEDPDTNQDIKQNLEIAKANGTLLKYLVNDVVSLYKEENKSEEEKEWINLKEIIGECKQLFEFGFQHKEIKIYVEFTLRTPSHFHTNKVKYRQIIINILGNALKYTMKGYVKIEIDYNMHDQLLINTIRDTGIGMSQQETSNLFQMFSKIDQCCDLNPQGVGLGLASCNSNVKKLGGTINIESELNVGTTFIISIPGKAREAAQEELKENAVMVLRNSEVEIKSTEKCECKNFLIVDDTDLNRFIIQRFLQQHNFEADEAKNGEEAVAKVVAKANQKCCKKYGIIFMDINMPVLDGLEATKILKRKMRDGEIHQTPIVAVTAAKCEEKEVKETFIIQGFDECGKTLFSYCVIVEKPLTASKFREIMAKFYYQTN